MTRPDEVVVVSVPIDWTNRSQTAPGRGMNSGSQTPARVRPHQRAKNARTESTRIVMRGPGRSRRWSRP